MFPPHIQKIISHYQILGYIPLDKFLHFLVGIIVTITLRFLNLTFTWIVVVLIILAAGKEIYDSYVISNTLGEHFVDFGATFIYPITIYFIKMIKDRAAGY